MSFNTEDFIIDLVKQLNLKNMDTPRRQRLEELDRQNVLTKKQATWKPGDDLPDIDKLTKDKTAYLYTEEPNTEENKPTEKVLESLYKQFSIILRDMASDRELTDNDKIKKFIDEFYGPGKAVKTYEIKPFADNEATGIATYIENNLSSLVRLCNGTLTEKDLSNLAQTLTLEDKSYVKNTKSIKTLDIFLDKIAYNVQYDGNTIPKNYLPDCFTKDYGEEGKIFDFDFFDKAHQQINSPVIKSGVPSDPNNPGDLKDFRDGLPKLLGKLISNEEALKAFSNKDEEKNITRWINKGINETNYKTGDNALAPKYADRKTFWKNAESNVKKFYVDTLGKLKEKHTRHKYQTIGARFIVKGLIDKGITPVSGTKKLLETLDAISGDMPNPVQSQLKWMKETLSSMSDTTVFKEALHDGAQLKKLVANIIDVAVENGSKKEEAKVTLETLALMRYTMFTSSVRDKIKNSSSFSFLSDKDLSWNKNEGIQFVTNAIDKTIDFTFRVGFEVANLAKNAINASGLRFKKKKKSGAAGDPTDEKAALKNELYAFWNLINSSANTKDYNPFRSHEKLQKASDKANEDYENDPDTKQKSFAKTLDDLTKKYDYSL